MTNQWLPHSRFSHAQHRNAPCASCHKAGESASSADILVPDLATCQSCHAGAKAEPNKVVSRCESCHGFHGQTPNPVFEKGSAHRGSKP